MKMKCPQLVRVAMAQQETRVKTKRWKRRRSYMDKQKFIGKQKAWDRAIRGAEIEQQAKAEQAKKSKEYRKASNGKRGK